MSWSRLRDALYWPSAVAGGLLIAAGICALIGEPWWATLAGVGGALGIVLIGWLAVLAVAYRYRARLGGRGDSTLSGDTAYGPSPDRNSHVKVARLPLARRPNEVGSDAA